MACCIAGIFANSPPAYPLRAHSGKPAFALRTHSGKQDIFHSYFFALPKKVCEKL